MKKMIMATFKDLNGITETNYLYLDYQEFLNDTWNPEDKARLIHTMDFVIHGKTYQERKANFEEIAKEFQAHDVGGLYYSDYVILQDYFETNARRYGLLKELMENCIV